MDWKLIGTCNLRLNNTKIGAKTLHLTGSPTPIYPSAVTLLKLQKGTYPLWYLKLKRIKKKMFGDNKAKIGKSVPEILEKERHIITKSYQL